jgi:hypothetical protein
VLGDRVFYWAVFYEFELTYVRKKNKSAKILAYFNHLKAIISQQLQGYFHHLIIIVIIIEYNVSLST